MQCLGQLLILMRKLKKLLYYESHLRYFDIFCEYFEKFILKKLFLLSHMVRNQATDVNMVLKRCYQPRLQPCTEKLIFKNLAYDMVLQIT